MPWGKHRGEDLEDVPESYLLWVLDHADNASQTLREAIRGILGLPPQSPQNGDGARAPPGWVSPDHVRESIASWYRSLALRFHPDRGGTTEAMQAVNEGHDLLQKLFEL